MSGEAQIVLTGNTTDQAELRYTGGALAIARWTLVVTPRVKDSDGWRDGEPTFYRCSAFKQLAESCAESIVKGMRLVVVGRFKSRTWETKAGEKRLDLEVDVDEVGASMRYATVKTQKAGRSGGSGDTPQATGGSGYDDPWSVPAGGSGAMDPTDPPFGP